MNRMKCFQIFSLNKVFLKFNFSLISNFGLWFFFVVVFLYPVFAIAQSIFPSYENKTISQLPRFYEVTTEAEAIANDFVSARKKAVKIAMKMAVNEAIKNILDEESDLSNQTALIKILRHPDQYIKSYRFLSSFDNTKLMLAEVRLELEIYTQELKQRLRSLGVLNAPAEERAVIILVMEKGISSLEKPFWETIPISEISLVHSFQEAGIQAVNRNFIRDLIPEENAAKAVQGNIASAVDIGNLAGADVVITGRAVLSKLQENGEIQANVTLKAISVASGSLIAARSEFASSSEEDLIRGELSAIYQATSKIGKFLIDSVRKFWNPKVKKSPLAKGSLEKVPVSDSTLKLSPQAPVLKIPSMPGDL